MSNLNLVDRLKSESGEAGASGLLRIGLIALAGALVITYGIETFNQVVNCDVRDPLLGLHTNVEHLINIQPYLNKLAMSFFEGTSGGLKLLSIQMGFCLK